MCIMADLYDAAEAGELEQVTLLVEQGVDKNQIGGKYGDTALSAAAKNNHFAVVQYLVEQGADMNKPNTKGAGVAPLHYVCSRGHLEVTRYLLEQGADRDKATTIGHTPLHLAASHGHLEIAKLLMIYGADLNARSKGGVLPIDIGGRITEEIKQAIRDEPRRRMDHGHKRATEQDRHPNTAVLASAQHEEEEQSIKKPCLDDVEEVAEGKVAEEDEPSEPSDEEDGGS